MSETLQSLMSSRRETVRSEERPATEKESQIESRQHEMLQESAANAAMLQRSVVELLMLVKKMREKDIAFPEEVRSVADHAERALQRIEGLAHNSNFSINAVTLIEGLNEGWSGRVGPNEFGVLSEFVEKAGAELDEILMMSSKTEDVSKAVGNIFDFLDGKRDDKDHRDMNEVLEEALRGSKAPSAFLRHLSDIIATTRRAETKGMRLKMEERPRFRELTRILESFNREVEGPNLGLNMSMLIAKFHRKLGESGLTMDMNEVEMAIRHDLGMDDDQKPETD